jgi:general secretion pathway protein C
MKRWPLLASFVLFIALCASAAYWAMQLFKPPLRPVAAPPRVAKADIRPDAAAGLFGGGGPKAAVATNYQLRGVIVSGNGRDSVAILSEEGKPALAVRINTEISPGVTVKEVHRDYVLLSEGGATKRVELPESVKAQANVATSSPVPTQSVPPARSTPGPRTMPAPSAPPTIASPPPATVVSPPQMAQPGMSRGTPAPARGTPAPAPNVPPGAQNIPSAPGTPNPTGIPSPTLPANPPASPEPVPPGAPVPGAVPTPETSTGSSGR